MRRLQAVGLRASERESKDPMTAARMLWNAAAVAVFVGTTMSASATSVAANTLFFVVWQVESFTSRRAR